MQNRQPQHAWQISQVQQLIGLPRRDIQRACYSGKGGAGILSPQDSSWGRRSYDLGDLAKLFLVKRYRDQGHTLNEARQAFADAETGNGWLGLLETQVDHLREQCARAAGALVQAEALRWAALNEEARERDGAPCSGMGSEGVLASFVARAQAASQLVSDDPDKEEDIDQQQSPYEIAQSLIALSKPAEDGAPQATACASSAAIANASAVLDAPGMDMAIEVLLGSGSFARIEQAAEALERKG